jgi:cytoskeleton protein RodZ
MVQPAPATASDTPAPPAAADDEVVILFSGPCWVDVQDATGQYKLFGEMSDGDRHVLGGEPPYSLIIGNASAVEMTVGGKPFDVAAIARGNVARFELDAAQLQQAAAGDGPGSEADADDGVSGD